MIILYKLSADENLFYRLSFQSKGNGENTTMDVYLTVFDHDYKMLGERKLDQVRKNHTKQFAKNGKLYLFENIDDELAFIALKIDLE